MRDSSFEAISILFWMSTREKELWPSWNLQAKRLDARPLPYENMIILFRSCQTFQSLHECGSPNLFASIECCKECMECWFTMHRRLFPVRVCPWPINFRNKSTHNKQINETERICKDEVHALYSACISQTSCKGELNAKVITNDDALLCTRVARPAYKDAQYMLPSSLGSSVVGSLLIL